MTKNDHMYHLLKLIHRRIIHGISLSFEYREPIEDVEYYSRIIGVDIITIPTDWGYLVLEKNQFIKQNYKIHLIDIPNPPSYLLGHIMGFPKEILANGHKHSVTLEGSTDEGRRVTIYRGKTDKHELEKIREGIKKIAEFLTYLNLEDGPYYCVLTL